MSFSVYAASSHCLATVPSGFLFDMFARSDIPVVALSSRVFSPFRPELPVSEEALMELVMQDTCWELTLSGLYLSEGHFHALRRASSILKLTLVFCSATVGVDRLPIAATERAFVECLVGIQCPVYMRWDGVNTSILARALPRASHLHELTLDMNRDVTPYISSIVQSLEANTGLVKLSVSARCNDFDFETLCHSLRSHTTLTSLEVYTRTLDRNLPVFFLAEDSKTIWLEAIIGLLKTNTVLHTIELPWRLTETPIGIYHQEIAPRLEMNRFRRHVLAIKTAIIGLVKTNMVLHIIELPWCLMETPTGIYHQEIMPRLEMNRFRRYFLAIKAAPRELHIKLLCFALPLVSNINLIFEVFRDSIDALLPMILAHDIKSVLVGAPNTKAELEAEIAELVEASGMKDLLLELLSMVAF